jgi:hypothetical protein
LWQARIAQRVYKFQSPEAIKPLVKVALKLRAGF